jgi:Chain length determinant protein
MNNSTPVQTEALYIDMSIGALLLRLRQRWYWLLASVILATSLAAAYAFLKTPTYQSSVLLAPAGESSAGMSSVARMAQSFGGLFGGGAERSNRAIAFSSLTSPYFIRSFIEDNNLLPILFAEMWDAEKGEWIVESEDDIPTLADGYELFNSKVLLVEEEEFTDLVTVYIEWKDPELAADWANKIVERVNSQLRTKAITDADLTISYLNEELAKTTAVALQQSLYFLVDDQIQKRTAAKVQKEYAYRVLSPGIPSDRDKFFAPNRRFVISAGVAVGLLFGMIVAFIVPLPAKRNTSL